MKTCITIFVFVGVLQVSQGLQCWQCDQATSLEDCKLIGQAVKCIDSQDICSTVVRRRDSENLIWKGCKQRTACQSDEKQNFLGRRSRQHQCYNDRPSSLCTCCCETSMCNENNMCAANAQCQPVPTAFSNGEVRCSDSNNPGSVCEFTCTSDGFSIQPTPKAGTSRCLRNGQWSQPKQCCARPCPPYVPIDYMVMVHASDAATWQMMTDKLAKSSIGTYNTGLDSMRLARIPFSGEVHLENAITFQDTPLDINSSSLFELVKMQKFAKTEDGLVNIGAALKYALSVFDADVRLRKHHLDVVIVTTDAQSDDEVLETAQALRDLGVLTFVRFIGGKGFNMTQLLEIAGDEERVFITDLGPSRSISSSELVQTYVCNDICRYH